VNVNQPYVARLGRGEFGGAHRPIRCALASDIHTASIYLCKKDNKNNP